MKRFTFCFLHLFHFQYLRTVTQLWIQNYISNHFVFAFYRGPISTQIQTDKQRNKHWRSKKIQRKHNSCSQLMDEYPLRTWNQFKSIVCSQFLSILTSPHEYSQTYILRISLDMKVKRRVDWPTKWYKIQWSNESDAYCSCLHRLMNWESVEWFFPIFNP